MTASSASGTADMVTPGYTARPDSVPAVQTNQPRWAPPSLRVRAQGCTYLVYCADAVSAAWVRSETCLDREEIREVGDSSEMLDAALTDDLGSAVTGTRIVLCGPETFVAVGASLARSHGALNAELVPLVLDDLQYDVIDERPRNRRVYCGSCRAISTSTAAVGDLIVCPACGTRVIVHYHFSRDTAAFLAQPLGRARPSGDNGFSAATQEPA